MRLIGRNRITTTTTGVAPSVNRLMLSKLAPRMQESLRSGRQAAPMFIARCACTVRLRGFFAPNTSYFGAREKCISGISYLTFDIRFAFCGK